MVILAAGAILAILCIGAWAITSLDAISEQIDKVQLDEPAEKEQSERENAMRMTEEGYKVYIDGQEVEPGTINMDHSAVTIRENLVVLDRLN